MLFTALRNAWQNEYIFMQKRDGKNIEKHKLILRM